MTQSGFFNGFNGAIWKMTIMRVFFCLAWLLGSLALTWFQGYSRSINGNEPIEWEKKPVVQEAHLTSFWFLISLFLVFIPRFLLMQGSSVLLRMLLL